MDEPLPSAIKAAEIITGGTKWDTKTRYPTKYGEKTVIGIADLIQSETALPDIVKHGTLVLRMLEAVTKKDGACKPVLDDFRKALSKAQNGS
jgi:hypothetical protein